MEGHVRVHCNAHTQGIYAGSLRNHVLPALGAKPVASVERAEVAALHYGMREDAPCREPGADGAVEDVLVLGGVGHDAARREPVPVRLALRGGPARALPVGGRVPPGGARRCANWRPRGPVQARAAAALRLIMLTGCRRGEVLTLKVERRRSQGGGAPAARREDGGAHGAADGRRRHRCWRGSSGCAGARGCFRQAGRTAPCRSLLNSAWHRVRTRAGVEDVRIHDLRHSCAAYSSNPPILLIFFKSDINPSAYSHRIRSIS